jgi:hypothetical protein
MRPRTNSIPAVISPVINAAWMACVIKRAHDIGSRVGLSRSLERKRSVNFHDYELYDVLQFPGGEL